MCSDGSLTIGFQTENESVIRKCFTLLEKTFNINKVAVQGKGRILSDDRTEDKSDTGPASWKEGGRIDSAADTGQLSFDQEFLLRQSIFKGRIFEYRIDERS